MSSLSINHIEIVVDDLTKFSFLFIEKMGFRPSPARETWGVRSLLLSQGRAHVRLMPVSKAWTEEDQFVSMHGTAVRDIGLSVPHVMQTVESVLAAGGRVLDQASDGKFAVVQLFDGLRHTLEETRTLDLACVDGETPNIVGIDHVAICLQSSRFDEVIERYARAFGLSVSHEEYVATDVTAMNSKVLSDEDGKTRFVFLEPKPAANKSQIEIFMNNHGGAGVQHVAFVVREILQASEFLRTRDVQFLPVPPSYYQGLEERVGPIDRELDNLDRKSVV